MTSHCNNLDTTEAVYTLCSMKYDKELTILDTDIQELLKIHDNHNSVYIDILPSPFFSYASNIDQDMSGNFVLTPSLM